VRVQFAVFSQSSDRVSPCRTSSVETWFRWVGETV
jgi:hypothetical protein